MTEIPIRPAFPDSVEVQTRIGWRAIFAGAMVALTLNLLLVMLGAAIGISVLDARNGNADAENVGWGALIWMFISALVSMFVGGYVTSRTTVGETKQEAALQGFVLTGVVFAMGLVLTALGAGAGLSALAGAAATAPRDTAALSSGTSINWEEGARRAGVPAATIEEWRRTANAGAGATGAAGTSDTSSNSGSMSSRNNTNTANESHASTRLAWATFIGALLSLGAAIGGAALGEEHARRNPQRGVYTNR